MIKFRALTEDDVEVRVAAVSQKGVSLVLYRDARVDQNVLDEAVGAENWQKSYEVIGTNLYCNVGIKVEREGGHSEWVWKQDVGVESYTEKEKGQASDAFKRACSCWGIGRELYTTPFIWVDSDCCSIELVSGNPDKFRCKDRFAVQRMDVEGGKITALSIINQKGIVVYTYGLKAPQKEAQAPNPVEPKPMLLDEAQKKLLAAEMTRTCVLAEQICSAYHLTSLETMTVGIYTKCMARLKATPTRRKEG